MNTVAMITTGDTLHIGDEQSIQQLDRLNKMEQRLEHMAVERGVIIGRPALNGRRLRAQGRTCTVYSPTARNVGQLVNMSRGSYVVAKDGSLRRGV